jgi:hypothetical protein
MATVTFFRVTGNFSSFYVDINGNRVKAETVRRAVANPELVCIQHKIQF